MGRTALFSRKQPGGVFTIDDIKEHPGTILFVGSTVTGATDGAGYGQNPDSPVATLDYAVGLCAANKGDTIYVLPGHVETLSAAAAVALDVAGVSVLGLGVGNDRPKFTMDTVNGASIAISAASVTVRNLIVIGNKDGLTQPIDITGNDCTIDIEYRDTSALIEAVAVILATTVSRLNVKLKYIGFTAGDAAARPVNLVAVTGARIEIDGYGVVSTAWVNFTTTLSTDVYVTGRTYTQGVTNGSRNVVDTITGSKWFMDIYDASAGARYSGGSAAAVASDDVSAANSSIVSTGVLVSTGNSSTVSLGVAGSTAHSSSLSATVSAGIAGSTADSSSLSATVSAGIAGSTADSSSLSAAVSLGVVAGAIGKPVGKASSLADNAIPNNSQAAGGLIATATSGDVYIEEVVFSKDGTALAGPTNLELTTNNTYGPNTAADILSLNAITALGAQDTLKMTGATTALKPFVLESTKALYIHGDDAAGTSAGNLRYAIIGRALTAGASLA